MRSRNDTLASVQVQGFDSFGLFNAAMRNDTQLKRYEQLLQHIDKHFKQGISGEEVEAITYYSYRNINRIYQALQGETIGASIRCLRLIKAAEYLKYSSASISDIACEVGFEELSTFSRAFSNVFGCAPSSYRAGVACKRKQRDETISTPCRAEGDPPDYQLVELPTRDVLFLEHRGPYDDVKGMERTWQALLEYAMRDDLLTERTDYLGEILDDDAITNAVHCRYLAMVTLEQCSDFEPTHPFRCKSLPAQRYARFIHRGNDASCMATYQSIFAHWMTNVGLELADRPILERYLDNKPGVDGVISDDHYETIEIHVAVA